MSVTLHGQKQLVSSEPRNVVDALLELWLAASSAMENGATAATSAAAAAETAADNDINATAEVGVSIFLFLKVLSGGSARDNAPPTTGRGCYDSTPLHQIRFDRFTLVPPARNAYRWQCSIGPSMRF